MQVIDVYDADMETAATNLKNALTQYAAAYFDSYVTDFTDVDGEKKIKCMIGQTAAFEIVYKNDSEYFKLYVNGTTFNNYYSSSRTVVKYVYVFENAVMLIFKAASQSSVYANMPLLLCKRENGDTAVTFFTNSSMNLITTIGSSSYSNYCCIISINRAGRAPVIDSLTMGFSDNSVSRVSGFTPFPPSDGIPLKNVFLVMDSDFRSHTEPFPYIVNNKTYTGLAGNYYAVKGT